MFGVAPAPLPVFGPDQHPDSLQRLSLVFRAGWSDETLPTHGIVDLLATYAIAGDAPPSVTRTIDVGPRLTSINVAAPPALLPEAVAAVCTRLAHPDVDMVIRMGALVADEPEDPATPLTDALINRFGARGPGLVGFGMAAMRRLSPDAILSTAARAFTTGNAAVATDATLPVGMTFPLRAGPFWPASELVTSPVVFPAGYPHSNSGQLIITGLASSSDANSVACRILATRVANELRHSQGLVYSPQGFTVSLGAYDLLALQTDLPPEAALPACKAIFDSIAALAQHGPTPEDLERERQSTLRAMASDGTRRMHGWTQARQCLRQQPPQSLDELRWALLGVTAHDVATAIRAMSDTVMLGVPGETSPSVADLNWESGPRDRRPSRARTIRFRPGLVDSRRAQPELRLSPVALWRGTSNTKTGVTIGFNDVAAMNAWPDGARQLIRTDAYSIAVDPAQWRGGEAVVSALDAAIDPALVVPMRERDPDDLTVAPSVVERLLIKPWNVVWILAAFAALVWTAWAALTRLSRSLAASPAAIPIAMVGVVLVVAIQVGMAIGVIRLVRLLRPLRIDPPVRRASPHEGAPR